jgi:methionine-gamma-lyase
MDPFGGMLAFELKGGADAAKKLLPLMRTAAIAASLGNVDSLIQLSSTMNYSSVPLDVQTRMGITPGLVRYSLGIEDTADILDDLDQALSKIQSSAISPLITDD